MYRTQVSQKNAEGRARSNRNTLARFQNFGNLLQLLRDISINRMVLEISSEGQFNSEIRSGGLVVVDFFTTWCGPCKMIAPAVEEFSRKYPDVKFLKVTLPSVLI